MMFVLACALAAHSQNPRANRGVDPSQIPDSVKHAVDRDFKGISVARWETRQGKKGIYYIAQFRDNGDQRTRARYDRSGNLVLTTKIYGPNHLPPVVATAAQRYSGYRPAMAEELVSVKKNKTWYSLRLLGASSKKTVLLDEKGNELAPSAAPEEVQPESAPTSSN